MKPIKESTYVKYLTKFLNNAGFEAIQLQTPRSYAGNYIKKEPVDLSISPGDWRIEVKRSNNDAGKVFYWKDIRSEQLLQLKELSEKRIMTEKGERKINCGILICWNKDEYTFIHTSEISSIISQDRIKIKKETCKKIGKLLSLKEFAQLLKKPPN